MTADFRTTFLRPRVLVGIGLATASLLVLISVATASEASAAATWKCRASLARVTVRNMGKVEPVTANPALANGCEHSRAGIEEISLGANGGAGGIRVQGPSAHTDIDPLTGAPGDQTATAETHGASVQLRDNKGRVVLGVTGIKAQQSMSCNDAGEVHPFDGFSEVADVTLNGNKIISPDGLLKIVGNGINGIPNNMLLVVKFNEVSKETAGGGQWLVRRAVHIKLLDDPTKGPLVDVVVGEARTGFSGDVCHAEAPPPPNRWMCKANVARISLGSRRDNIEPMVANKPEGTNCRPDATGLKVLQIGDLATIDALRAQTFLDPPQNRTGNAYLQTAGALAKLADVTLLGTPDTNYAIRAQGVISQASAHCDDNRIPVFEGDTNVLTLTINGQTIDPNGTFEQIGDGINGIPLGDTLRVTFNEETVEGNPTTTFEKHIFTAAHIQVLRTATGESFIDIALGETTVGRKRDVCSAGLIFPN